MYALLFRLVFARMDAERAHRLGFGLIRLAGAVPGLTALLRRLLAPRDPGLRITALGRRLPGPLGLAAGFDKDALAPDALGALGFGFVEVGTVTARPQPGNPRPRLFRLPADRALVNRMGFNNHGAERAAERLAGRRGSGPHRLGRRGPGAGRTMVGANIGRTKATPDSEAVQDYVHSASLLGPVADYLVVNVSSPNTPGLRDLQATEQLRPLLRAVRAALDAATAGHLATAGHPSAAGDGAAPGGGRRVPLLVKIAPDLLDQDIDAIADLALELGLDGIIATNTTVARTGLRSPEFQVTALGPGGLSGPVLQERSLEVLRRLHDRTDGRLLLVAAGGITSGEDAWQRIRAGAGLLQAYTGFIYGGPLWPRRVHRDLARAMRADGFSRLEDAVGAGVRP